MKTLFCICFVFYTTFFVFQSTVLAQDSQFKPSYQENRVIACVHYFFSLFEHNPRDAEKLSSLLVSEGLEIKYPWAEFKSQAEFKKWVLGLPNEFQDAHHVRSIKVEKSDGNITAIADVFWENKGPKGEYDSAYLEYIIEFVDNGNAFPKIKKLECRKVANNK